MSKAVLLAVALTFTTGVSHAVAQAASDGSQQLGGPLVPGVCVLSRQDVLADSKVGQAAAARLRALAGEAEVELDTERKAVEAEIAVIEKNKAAAASEARRKPIVERWNAVQLKAGQRSRELEVTRQKALSRIAVEAQPVVAEVYRAHSCGLLFAREMMLGGNSGADLTAEVIKGLDAKITTINFERENLPAESAQPRPLASR
jgi:Skp family chaperone for outer membrane proteins